jgi:hypothetical protein
VTASVAGVRRSFLTVPMAAIAGLSLALGLSVVVPGPSTAAPAGTAAAPVADTHPEWGATTGRDATVRKGCHGYAYSYTLTPPDGDWALETFLVGPKGKQYASGYFLTGTDPLAGSGAFRLCQRSTRAGTYTIRALLTVENGVDHDEGYLPESTFRLRKPRR